MAEKLASIKKVGGGSDKVIAYDSGYQSSGWGGYDYVIPTTIDKLCGVIYVAVTTSDLYAIVDTYRINDDGTLTFIATTDRINGGRQLTTCSLTSPNKIWARQYWTSGHSVLTKVMCTYYE